MLGLNYIPVYILPDIIILFIVLTIPSNWLLKYLVATHQRCEEELSSGIQRSYLYMVENCGSENFYMILAIWGIY